MDNNFNYENNNYEIPSYIPQKYKRSNKGFVFAAVAVALCILFGGAGFFFGAMTVKESKSTKNESSEVESSGNYVIDTSSTDAVKETSHTSIDISDYSLEVVDADTYYTVKSVAKLTMDSVVEITTETTQTSVFMQQYVTTGAGSGVIITTDGYIVTNDHVVSGASSITVRLRNGEEFSATLIGTDEETDIAVIKITAENLSAATFGDSSSLEVGDQVVAIGNPLGELGGTVTEGIISALERDITIDGKEMVLLQHSAAVNPGNSGGGLFNGSAQLIGIVNAKYSEDDVEGLGFAIPTATAIPIIKDLMEYGYVQGRTDIGATFVDLTSDSYAQWYGYPEKGVYVYSVEKGSDADSAGLETVDRIISVNGIEISSSSDIENIIKNCAVGDTITIQVERYTRVMRKYTSEEITLTLTFTEYIPK